jgi:hypothetical protein
LDAIIPEVYRANFIDAAAQNTQLLPTSLA